MNFEISNRMSGLKPSIIRELLKQMADPALISFAGGNPAQDSFPAEEICRFSDDLLRSEPVKTLQYSVSEGIPEVREAVKQFANRLFPICKESDSLVMMSGSQQILDLTAKCLCNEGAVVAAEEPAFLSAYLTFRSSGAEVKGVPIQPDGVDLEALERVLSANPKPAFFYCIPNFQNPTGYTTSLEKRKAIYELTERYGVPVLEDDPYGELRFSGEALPPIKALGTGEHVIYAGSFSKILCPGMRLAYCIADQSFMRHMVTAKQCSDVHTNVWAQRVCEKILTQTDMNRHLARLRSIYGEKAKQMMDALDAKCPQITYVRPEGGMFLWGTLPQGISMPDFVQRCLEKKLAVVPGNAFYVDDSAPCNSFRMNFSAPNAEQIERGVEIMAGVLAEMAPTV